MTRYIILLLLILTAVACKKKCDDVLVEKPVIKKIEFHVHASSHYTTKQLQQVQAEVKLGIYKINLLTNKYQLVWDTVLASRSLVQYPHLPQKVWIEKEVGVIESVEKLEARYATAYKTPEGNLQGNDAETCEQGKAFLFLDVGI